MVHNFPGKVLQLPGVLLLPVLYMEDIYCEYSFIILFLNSTKVVLVILFMPCDQFHVLCEKNFVMDNCRNRVQPSVSGDFTKIQFTDVMNT